LKQGQEELGPCVLEGETVRLEPLNLDHAQSLVEAGKGFDWAWLSRDLSTTDSMKGWIIEALQAQAKSLEFPFTVFHKSQNRIIGSTRYMDIRSAAKGVEIGWTWYSPSVWGTNVNPEAKLLLLQRAFEDWGAIRVQLKTDNKNKHSQNAILKLGAKFEGQLRNHMIRRDGTIRHTMMYSITREEWPTVKSNLHKRLSLK
jgi:RimJ/RimL family protein N-acetyltransferase